MKQKEEDCMNHEQEIVTLRAEVYKLNQKLRSSKVLDGILNCQRSPLIKTSLGYVGESSCFNDEEQPHVKEEKMPHEEVKPHVKKEKLHEEQPHVKEDKKPHDEEKTHERKPHAKTGEKSKVEVLHKSTNIES